MALNNIEYIDREYARCLRGGKSRVIKARMSSFRSIADRFNNFRIRLLENKLDKMRDKSLEEKYSEDNFDIKIDKKTKAMAKLEEKIMVLSKEEVPTDYVSKRAIKLKKTMIDNLTFNSDMFYTIGLDRKEEIFGDDLLDESQNDVSDTLEDVIDGSDELDSFIDVDSLHETGSSDYSEGLPDIDVANVFDGGVNVIQDDITRQAIADVVNAELEGIDSEKHEEHENLKDDSLNAADASTISGEMSKEEVKEVIEKAFKEVELSGSDGSVVADDEQINAEVDSAIERIRVSQNNSSTVNSGKYDDEGEIKPKSTGKYQYVPMTDEEIRDSQRKLGFDENGNVIAGSSSASFEVEVPKVSLDEVFVPKSSEKRDFPVVVEDRRDTEEVFDLDSDKNMFDVIENSSSHGADVVEDKMQEFVITEPGSESKDFVSTSSKLEDYLSLKDKILQLQRQKQISHEKKVQAERIAAEKAEKAQEVKRMFEDSQRTYEESLERLRAYTESLEEECEINSKDAELAETDAQMSDNFIEIQQKKADDNYRVIREINGIINGESEDSTGGKAK